MYLPLYSPDLSRIEKFFAELKAFIRWNEHLNEEYPDQGFDGFLEWCVDVVGAKVESAKGHFQHAGLSVEEPWAEFERNVIVLLLYVLTCQNIQSSIVFKRWNSTYTYAKSLAIHAW